MKRNNPSSFLKSQFHFFKVSFQMITSQYTSEQERQFDRLLYVDDIRKKYRLRKGEDGIYEIPCRRGDIEPFSFTELCCYQDTGSTRGINLLLEKLPSYCVITQQGDYELVFKFPFEKLDEIADLVKAKKRKVLSEEHKAKLLKNAVFFLPGSNKSPQVTGDLK